MAHNIVDLRKCSVFLYIECVWLGRVFLSVSWISLVDSIQIFYILDDFLSTCTSIVERSTEVSNCNCGFISFSLQFCQLLLHLFFH